jgi:hypothetical protein
VISTERGFQTGKGLFRSPSNDNHLRAVVDKRSGATRFEVRQVLTYMGPVRGYGEVAYQTAKWPVQAPVTKIKDNASHCFVFEAPEALPRGDRVRRLRKRAAPRRRRARAPGASSSSRTAATSTAPPSPTPRSKAC